MMSALSTRLGMAVLAVETIVLAGGGALLIQTFSDNLEHEMLSRIAAPGLLVQSGGLSLSAVGSDAVMRPLVGNSLMTAMLIGVNGIVLHSTDPSHVGLSASQVTGMPTDRLTPPAGRSFTQWRGQGATPTLTSVTPIVLVPSGQPLFYLFVEMDARTLAKAKRTAMLNIALALVATGILSTLLVHFLIRRSVLKPVQDLSGTVQRIAAGDLSVRCPPYLSGELGRLAQGLNSMADSIETSDQDMRRLNAELEQKYAARTADLKHELKVRADTEARLREARDTAHEALQAKSRFLAAASHDLRQPVHALRLLLSAVEGVPAGETEELQGLLGEMKCAVGNLAEQLNTMLDISRLEAGIIAPQLADWPVNSLLGDLYQQFQRQAATSDTRLEIVACSAFIRTDGALLKRILANLLSNALRFAEGGTVLMGCRRRGPLLEIQVWDNGCGIAADSLEEIFEDFKQIGNDARQQAKGLGLGLSIVRRLSNLLAHRVRVASWPGRGTMMSVSVPLAEDLRKVPNQAELGGLNSQVQTVIDVAMPSEARQPSFIREGYKG